MSEQSGKNTFLIENEDFLPRINNDSVYVILERGIPVQVTKTIDRAKKYLINGRTIHGPVDFEDNTTISFPRPRKDPIFPDFYPPDLPDYRKPPDHLPDYSKPPEFAKKNPLPDIPFRPQIPKQEFPPKSDLADYFD